MFYKSILVRWCWDDLGVGRGDLSDEQWADLARVLPRPLGPGRAGPASQAADRRDPVAGADGCAVAGCPGVLWPVADGLWAVPPLAAGRHLGPGGDPAAGRGGRGGPDPLAGERGLHGLPGAPARGRRPPGWRCAAGTAGRDAHRAGRSRAGPLTRRVLHQGASGL